MIDTIVVKFEVIIGHTDLAFWNRTTEHKSDGRHFTRYLLNVTLDNGSVIKCTYYPYNYQGYPQLMVELSLPKIVYGNNYTMVYDIDGAIDSANQLLATITGLPPIDLRLGVLHRLDACHNHQVGDLVPYYIQPLQSLKYTRRKTMPYTDEGVQFVNKQQNCKFYDKEKECIDDAAHGILRQEATLRKKAIVKLTGQKIPTVCDLTVGVLADVLEEDLRALNLLGRSIANHDTALEMLARAEGETASYFYYGLLHANKEYPSKDTIAAATKTHPRSMDRRLQKIVQAGVPLTLTDTEQPLPPLVIDREMIKIRTKMGEEIHGDAESREV